MQPTSSYKVRGAFNTVLRLAEEHGANPPLIVTASAGNHGRAMAWAVRGSNIALTVYVPEKGAAHEARSYCRERRHHRALPGL